MWETSQAKKSFKKLKRSKIANLKLKKRKSSRKKKNLRESKKLRKKQLQRKYSLSNSLKTAGTTTSRSLWSRV